MLKAISLMTAAGVGLSGVTLSTVPARAGGGDVAAGIIGFAAGAIVGSQLSKNRPVNRPRGTSRTSSGRSAEQRAYWKSVQAALNDRGFAAGPVDGAPGRKTRAAIRSFQASLPAEPTGTLTPEQTAILFGQQPPAGTAPMMVAPPVGYQTRQATAFPNVTLPNAAAATGPAVVTAPGVTFPSQETPEPVQPVAVPAPSFPQTQIQTADEGGQRPAVSSEVAAFPAPDTAGNAPTPAAVQTATMPAAILPQGGAQPATPNAVVSAPSFVFPVVQDGAPSVTQTPIITAAEPAMPVPATAPAAADPAAPVPAVLTGPETSTPAPLPVAASPSADTTAPGAATAPAQQPAAQPQATIHMDENGNPYIMVAGQKFLLQAAAPGQ